MDNNDAPRSRVSAVLLGLLIVGALAAAQGQQKFTGTITDSMCAQADHSRMRMGSTDAECTSACVDAHGAVYVLYNGKATYTLSDQPAAERFAGQRVTVTGTLDSKTRTIRVESISAAQ